MKRFEIALKILPLLLLFSAACAFAAGAKGTVMQTKNTFYTISAQEAKKSMDSGRPVVIVDVRTKSEYDEGHIPNAVLIPNETISAASRSSSRLECRNLSVLPFGSAKPRRIAKACKSRLYRNLQLRRHHGLAVRNG